MEADTRIVIARLHKINVHCRDVPLYQREREREDIVEMYPVIN